MKTATEIMMKIQAMESLREAEKSQIKSAMLKHAITNLRWVINSNVTTPQPTKKKTKEE